MNDIFSDPLLTIKPPPGYEVLGLTITPVVLGNGMNAFTVAAILVELPISITITAAPDEPIHAAV